MGNAPGPVGSVRRREHRCSCTGRHPSRVGLVRPRRRHLPVRRHVPDQRLDTASSARAAQGVLDEDATELEPRVLHLRRALRRHARTASGCFVMRRPSTDAQWQFRLGRRRARRPDPKNDDGAWITRVDDGACIFLNRPDFHRAPAAPCTRRPRRAASARRLEARGLLAAAAAPRAHDRRERPHDLHAARVEATRLGRGRRRVPLVVHRGARRVRGPDLVVRRPCATRSSSLVGEPVYERLFEELEPTPVVTPVPHPAAPRR